MFATFQIPFPTFGSMRQPVNKLLSPIRLIFFFAGVLLSCKAFAQFASFPGAQGFGTSTPGGRGGTIIEVTNLNDAGPGSFRAACAASGPRIIVFRTGGIINLQSEIQLTEPYVTIAAQTAPGDGIVLKKFSFDVFTHDVIIRGMRFRPGDDADGEQPDLRDCMSLQGGTQNVVIDHCSFSWGLDENVSLWDTANNVTVQWCIISEALFANRHPKGPHSMGYLIGDGAFAASTHHNLLAHNNGRNPLFKGGTDLEFTNNVIYDWGYSSEFLRAGDVIKADAIGNYWKPRTYSANELPVAIDFDSSTANGSRLYFHNNYSNQGLFLTPAQIQSFGGNGVVFANASLMSINTGITQTDAFAAYDTVLAYAGALHPQRDATDIRVVNDVRDSTGGLLDCIYNIPMLLDSGVVMYGTDSSIIYSQLNTNPAISPEGRKVEIVSGTGAGQIRHGVSVNTISVPLRIVEGVMDAPWSIIPDSTSHYTVTATCGHYLGAWPVYNTGTPYTDNDHDGMDDAWETAHGLNPNNAADANQTGLSGGTYTNVEVYLNGYYTPNNPSGIENVEPKNIQLSLSPNPFNASATINIYLPEAATVEINIYNATGKVVRSLGKEILGAGQNHITWNGTALANGLYFIECKSATSTQFIKAVISR